MRGDDGRNTDGWWHFARFGIPSLKPGGLLGCKVKVDDIIPANLPSRLTFPERLDSLHQKIFPH